ncbi:unnamed protein product, partial [Cuscuta epithymum]
MNMWAYTVERHAFSVVPQTGAHSCLTLGFGSFSKVHLSFCSLPLLPAPTLVVIHGMAGMAVYQCRICMAYSNFTSLRGWYGATQALGLLMGWEAHGVAD